MLRGQKVEYAAFSDIGFRRRNNQDSYAVQMAGSSEEWSERGHLFLVADGMGGHAAGELASKIAADTIPHTYYKLRDQPVPEALRAAVLAGNAAINARGELNRDFTRMGTTCTTLVLYSEGALIAHVGDSRTYRIRSERIEQLTFDHSLQWELLRQGKLSPEEIFRSEPRNVITRSLGPSAAVQVDIEGPFPSQPRDVYVLCSDGLSSLVRDEEIGIVARELPPAEACRLLVNLSNLRGGPDNITVLVARVGGTAGAVPDDDLSDSKVRPRIWWSWAWPVGVGSSVLAFFAGQALAVMDHPVAGFLIEALGILGFGALVLGSLRTRRLSAQRTTVPETKPGAPYRTTSARMSPDFIVELANLESNLQRSAMEEGWSIDWNQHAQSYQPAKSAIAEQRYSDALREFAKTIQILMEGIQQLRRQRDQAARWGVRANAGRDDPNPDGK